MIYVTLTYFLFNAYEKVSFSIINNKASYFTTNTARYGSNITPQSLLNGLKTNSLPALVPKQ